MDDLVLAVDIGTSHVRAAVFDGGGNPVAGSRVSLPVRILTAAQGRATVEPDELSTTVGEAVTRAATGYGPAGIRAVGGSCMWHSLIGVDAAGRPSTPVLTWADTRSAPDAGNLRTEIDEPQVHAATGCMLRPSFWPAKLRWLARTHPREFSSTRRWMGAAEWLWGQLGAGRHSSSSMASGTGLFELRAPTWHEPLLERCGIGPDRLPAVSEEPRAGRIGSGRWFPAIGAGAASNLGSGATGAGRAAINFGTTAAFRIVSGDPGAAPPLGLFAYRLDLDRYVVGGATSNAGNLRAWCRKQLGLPDEATVEAAMARRPLPDHGLTVLPYWNGERAPRWRESVWGAVVGIGQSTTALDILQAITEAAYSRIAEIADLVVGNEPVEIVVSGGGCRSRAELQRLANVLGRPVLAAGEREASLRGAAIFALERLGRVVPPPPLGELLEPDAVAVARYAEFRRDQAELDARLNP